MRKQYKQEPNEKDIFSHFMDGSQRICLGSAAYHTRRGNSQGDERLSFNQGKSAECPQRRCLKKVGQHLR